MSKELRYLLHGNKDKYDDAQTYLYITSQESTLWQKVGLQILGSRGEAWRLIDSALVEHIPSSEYQTLKIERLKDERVIDDLIRRNPNYVDGNKLEPNERHELLSHISRVPANQNLWRSLKLHETVDDKLACIEEDRVYLENPDFPRDEKLRQHIVLIRQNNEIQQNWIPLWTPDAAIAKILSLPTPHNYCDLILDALHQISADQKQLRRHDLQKTPWLSPNGYSPQDILRLPDNLEQHAKAIASLDSSKHPENALPEAVRSSNVYRWVRDLFTSWNEENVIKKILEHPQNNLEHWECFCPVILDALFKDISDDLKTDLEIESWLFLGDRTISPPRIIEINGKKLKKHLSTLINLSACEYVEVSQLPEAVTEHKNFIILNNNLFSQWNENDVLEYVLTQNEPHKYFEIILDALSSLLPQSFPNDTNTQELSTLPWLVDKQGNAIDPRIVLHYPDLNDEIEGLLSLVSDSYISSSQLAKQIRKHNACWQWLTETVFIEGDEALDEIGNLLSQAPEYQLGKFDDWEDFPLDKCWEVFKNLDVSFLPAWSFAKKLSKEKFEYYLLPNLLDEINGEKLRNLLKLLSSLYPQVNDAKEIFNIYLGLAVEYETFSEEILPHIQLLNRLNKWRTPDRLTWGNSENIEEKCLLDIDQEDILSSYLENMHSEESFTSQISETFDNLSNYALLKNYFADWNHNCAWEPIGAFLILIYGDDGQCGQLARNYLGYNHNPESLRDKLVQDLAPIAFDICLGSSKDRTTRVRSILGKDFVAELRSGKKPVNLFINSLSVGTRKLELLSIQPTNFTRHELSEILKESAKTLLQNVYGISNTSLDQIWKDLLQSDQLNIQVAKDLLLRNAPYILRELGMHKQNHSVNELLGHLKELDREKARSKNEGNATSIVRDLGKEIDATYQKLANLLEDETPESNLIRASLLESVRNKIVLYGYNHQSIPFEIFQNSDDAAWQWMEMSPSKQLEDERRQFVVVCDEKTKILFIHAGRPINCSQHIDFPQHQYREKSYDNDLENMLMFNFSDKGERETGKFGLGFKSVYLACNRPLILSKNLGFSVEGGLIPSQLEPKEVNRLREVVEQYGIYQDDATIIELTLEKQFSFKEIVDKFYELATILIVFSRVITSCRFIYPDRQESITWEKKLFLNIQGIEAKRVEIGNKMSAMLCFRISGEVESALLLGIAEKDGRLFCSIPENTPTFWVTAPTQEKLPVGFILNAAFKVTTGRTKLDSTAHNSGIAKHIGSALGTLLSNLFKRCESDWETVAEELGISVDLYDFWNFMWQELVVSWQKVDKDERRELLAQILGSDRGMGYLIFENKALPNGLYGFHRKLIDIAAVDYRVAGKLAKKDCFLPVSHWDNFQQYQGSLITRERWDEAKLLLGDVLGNLPIKDLKLLNVLKDEIRDVNNAVAPNKAEKLGTVISIEFLETFNDTEGEELQNFLQLLHFKSQTGEAFPAKKLLLINTEEPEEKRLAAFASANWLLHADYSNTSLNFFLACRLQCKDVLTSVPIEELVRWAKAADTENKKKAVLDYLILGDRRLDFAKQLRLIIAKTWMESYLGIKDQLGMNLQQDLAERASRGEIAKSQVYSEATIPETETAPQLEPVDAEIFIQRIYDWWQENRRSETQRYNKRLYTVEIEEFKRRLSDNHRGAWLTLFFLGFTHRMGQKTHEQHRGFIKFCEANDWWRIFSKMEPHNHHTEWMGILDKYMESQVDDTKWNAWIEKFPSIYRTSKYLLEHIQSFRAMDQYTESFDLRDIMAPRRNQHMSGGGVDVPPLNLGIGANFVVRELVRIGIVKDTPYVIPHCFVPRANVRKVFTFLGCEDLRDPNYRNSRKIYSFLKEHSNDPSFSNAFDIPFEIYSEDKSRIDLDSWTVNEDDRFDENEDSQ
jgi:hypothetical protein